MQTETILVTITPEAAARVAELGLQREFEQILEHTKQVVPVLRKVHVFLVPDYEEGGDPGVVLEATRADSYQPGDRTEDEWSKWKISTFSPEVWVNFIMWTIHEADNGR